MITKPDGGPAFPAQPIFGYPGGSTSMSEQGGMSLRDYMAVHALARIPYDPRTPHSKQAAEAYRMADAMISERAK